MKLLTLQESPIYTRDNFIHSGYRPILTYYEALYSLFYLHNQWINIWTMLIGIPFSLIFAIFSDLEYSVNIFMFLGWFSHSICSASYHLFQCVSEKDWIRLKRLDYIMIFVQAIFLSFSLSYYSFLCKAELFFLTIMTVTIISIINIITSSTNIFLSIANTRLFRLFCTSIVVLIYLSPCIYEVIVNKDENVYFWAITCLILSILAAIIWAFRIPERWYPKRFDLHFHSHSIMHIIITIGHFTEWKFIIACKNQNINC